MRKIAVPVVEERLSEHFGHCNYFEFFEVEGGKIIKTDRAVPPPHQPGVLPLWLAELKATDIIAGGMGQRAVQLFLQNGISVYLGAEMKSAEELALDLANDRLQCGQNYCTGHGDGDGGGQGHAQGHNCGH